jgi:GrpB-like predicted nucleotidyltransferase (UPF0157 family)
MVDVVVEKYNPIWAEQFKLLYDRIWPSISDVALSLEHVGSTSVPGLSAKPIIDLTIVVNKKNLEIIIQRLAGIGIEHRGDLGIEGREAFTRLKDYPEHNLYACVTGSQALRNHLAVRDALRENSSLVQEYGKLKMELARKFSNDIDSYVEGKTDFILNILKEKGFELSDLENIKDVNKKQRI